MKKAMELTHEFVEFIPAHLDAGKIYVSIAYATVVHKCCCGCGNEVVTPLAPRDWKLTFDGETVSLYPSIGNWSFSCRSHYWIKRNRIVWAEQWTQEEIKDARTQDRAQRADAVVSNDTTGTVNEEPETSLWAKFKAWWNRLWSRS